MTTDRPVSPRGNRHFREWRSFITKVSEHSELNLPSMLVTALGDTRHYPSKIKASPNLAKILLHVLASILLWEVRCPLCRNFKNSVQIEYFQAKSHFVALKHTDMMIQYIKTW